MVNYFGKLLQIFELCGWRDKWWHTDDDDDDGKQLQISMDVLKSDVLSE